MTALPPLAVAMGDPAGVGPEIIAKAWARRREERLLPFFAVGDVRAIARVGTARSRISIRRAAHAPRSTTPCPC